MHDIARVAAFTGIILIIVEATAGNYIGLMSTKVRVINHIRAFFYLSSLLWYFAITNISKSRVIQNLHNLVSLCIREWLELPTSATLSGIISWTKPLNQWRLVVFFAGGQVFEKLGVVENILGSYTQKIALDSFTSR